MRSLLILSTIVAVHLAVSIEDLPIRIQTGIDQCHTGLFGFDETLSSIQQTLNYKSAFPVVPYFGLSINGLDTVMPSTTQMYVDISLTIGTKTRAALNYTLTTSLGNILARFDYILSIGDPIQIFYLTVTAQPFNNILSRTIIDTNTLNLDFRNASTLYVLVTATLSPTFKSGNYSQLYCSATPGVKTRPNVTCQIYGYPLGEQKLFVYVIGNGNRAMNRNSPISNNIKLTWSDISNRLTGLSPNQMPVNFLILKSVQLATINLDWEIIWEEFTSYRVSNLTDSPNLKTYYEQISFAAHCPQSCNGCTGMSNFNCTTCAVNYRNVSGECVLICSQTANTDNIDKDNGICNCEFGFEWEIDQCISCSEVTLLKYPECCAQMNNTDNKSAVNGKCGCATDYSWDDTAGKCLDCSQLNPLQHPECIDCFKLDHTDNVTSQGGKCTCLSSYEWDQTHRVCVFSCQNISFASSAGVQPQTCICLDKFDWDNTTKSCVINCTQLLPYSNPQRKASFGMCNCIKKFIFNNITKQCEYNCSSVILANLTATRLSFDSCVCMNNSAWIASTKSCQINCTKVYKANGTISRTRCKCSKNYQYSPTTGTCSLNCSLDQYSLPLVGTEASGTCRCFHLYFWDSFSETCRINCARAPGSNGLAVNNTQCACSYKALIWNSYFFGCIPKCRTMRFAIFLHPSGTRCLCQQGRYWTSHPPKCN